ncbi:MAG: cytochrome C554 [Bacteroidetes bacterium]|nr:cytochrome C554 [Bacteroidota bacterium]
MKSKMKIQLPVILLLGFFVFAASQFQTDAGAGDFKYVGVDKCAGACHKGESKGNQLEIWKDSKHAQAYNTLLSAVSDSIAKAWGSGTSAAETPQCLKCHVLGKDIVESELTETFDKTQGVQCETCHGAGSEYKKLSIMKDKNAAIENGLIIPPDNEAFCKGCHNSESPFYKEFNYEENWAKIKHPAPEK